MSPSKHNLPQSVTSPNFMQQLQTLLNQEMKDKNHPITLGNLAQLLPMSKRTLEHQIKIHTQQTPKQYLQQWRLQKAHQLLVTQKCTTTKAAAYTIGYTNPSHFALIFKKQFGYSPKGLIAKQKELSQTEQEKSVTKK